MNYFQSISSATHLCLCIELTSPSFYRGSVDLYAFTGGQNLILVHNSHHRRTGQHPLPEWRTQIVCHAREKRKNNELLQSLFVDGHRVVPDERLLCYPTRNIFQVDGYLFRSVTQLVKQMCCLLPELRICPKLGGQICPNWGVNCPPDPPSRAPMILISATMEKTCHLRVRCISQTMSIARRSPATGTDVRHLTYRCNADANHCIQSMRV